MERVVLLADLNSFYASVECLYNPAIRDEPVAVAGSVDDRHGIILAANPLAKRFKVRTGEAIWQAKQKCAHLVTVHPHMDRYLAMSQAAGSIYREYSARVAPFGLDENYIDITGNGRDGEETAQDIRRRIKRELGITVSIGVSYNRVFAKLASEFKKPDAVSCIRRSDYKEKVWPLPVSDLYMVGPATTKKLQWDCIHTIGDLANTDPERLKRRLGVNGLMLWRYANGEDHEPVTENGWQREIKSVGNSTTAPKDLVSPEDIRITTMLLAESVAERMRKKGFVCRTVQTSIRYNDLSVFQHQTGLPFPCRTALRIGNTAIELILKNRRENVPIRSIGVRACNLILDEQPQLSFLPEQAAEQRQERLETTMQDLRRRFGHFCVERAVMLADRRLSALDTQDKASCQSVAFYRGGEGAENRYQ